jgi:hypothetical protein
MPRIFRASQPALLASPGKDDDMKKFLFVALFVLALAMFVTPAFALECKTGNYGSDECWTNVQVSASETNQVNKGTVLMYAVTENTADNGAFVVRVVTATTDAYKVAGVAQQTIATGDRGNILVRGQGKIKSWGAVTSGDRLFVNASNNQNRYGRVCVSSSLDVASAASRDKAIAFALETSTTDATADAYIVVI